MRSILQSWDAQFFYLIFLLAEKRHTAVLKAGLWKTLDTLVAQWSHFRSDSQRIILYINSMYLPTKSLNAQQDFVEYEYVFMFLSL